VEDDAVPGDEELRHLELLEAIRGRSRRMAMLYAAAAVLLVPWTVYLAVTLPRRDIDTHYRGAWVGFDILLVVAILLTAYYAFRMDDRVQLPAMATATLLIVDAWFDVMTAGRRSNLYEAVLMALCIEIPAAIFTLYLARRVNRNAWVIAVHQHEFQQLE
jgi:protein-S-isoprenylcysteine O-methyltransferase Ste14